MPLFAWDESLSVGYEPIDEQHKRLIALINKLHDAMIEGKGQEVLGELWPP
jgi:hemerythrin